MAQNYHRRHSRWYEVIIFNFWFQIVIGYLLIVILPQWLRYGGLVDSLSLQVNSNTNTLYANSIAFLAAFFILRKMHQFPGARNMAYIFPMIAGSWLVIIAILFFLRADYSRSILAMSYLFANIWAMAGFYLGRHYYTPKFTLIPFGSTLNLKNFDGVNITVLDKPDLENRRYDAVVTDLTADMPSEWLHFIAECTLAHIPVYNTDDLIESLTGRTKISHLSENNFGHLQPSTIYMFWKRIIDAVAVILLLPIVLPILLITMFLIKIDSSGPIFFNQERMGYRGRPFKMYKLRSMHTNMEGRGFTQGTDDPRITRVGKFIRKFRIDELPQLLNVLKGDMSLIGPRPESLELSKWYEKDVPFFAYRHIVRPGITGWAQVTQGYAAEVEGMNLKLQYDFYYIKHFSPWLDVLIVFKTIRTILTGFGAR